MGYHVQELLYPVEREHCLFIDRDIQAACLRPSGPIVLRVLTGPSGLPAAS